MPHLFNCWRLDFATKYTRYQLHMPVFNTLRTVFDEVLRKYAFTVTTECLCRIQILQQYLESSHFSKQLLWFEKVWFHFIGILPNTSYQGTSTVRSFLKIISQLQSLLTCRRECSDLLHIESWQATQLFPRPTSKTEKMSKHCSSSTTQHLFEMQVKSSFKCLISKDLFTHVSSFYVL